MLSIKRIYDAEDDADGVRFLVERLWPRGVKKADAKFDSWLKDAAPSSELRKWFNHDPEKWSEFQTRYRAELKGNPQAWQPIVEALKKGNVTLLYSARDTEHNNALVLKTYIEKHAGK